MDPKEAVLSLGREVGYAAHEVLRLDPSRGRRSYHAALYGLKMRLECVAEKASEATVRIDAILEGQDGPG